LTVNRGDFQALALERLDDAQALLAAGRFGCAYYVAGYAVEFALKACIARKTQEFDFPPKDAPALYVHDLQRLAKRAELDGRLEKLGVLWIIVKDWSETSRYESHVLECLRESW